jgi:calcium-dependent protein kinase
VSRPEFEHDDDVAQNTYLRRPGDGGFARRNFVGDTKGRAFHKVYKFTGKQKEGGMAAIRGALHRQTGVPVAVKLVAKSRVQDAKAMLREIEFLKVTDHPNIVRLHETFEDAENIYLVMEYCMGDTLGDRILSRHKDGTGFTETEVAAFAREILRAVAYCHTQSIVHRDIKPCNFILASRLKLVDFGVSGVVPAQLPESRFLTAKTGTDGYMAPEVIRARPYGPSADIFSVGATLYTLITGEVPLWLDAVGTYSLPSSRHMDALSREGCRLVRRMLSPSPQSRPTASEVLNDPWLRNFGQACLQAEDSQQLLGNALQRLREFGGRNRLQCAARASVLAFAHPDCPEVRVLQEAFFSADRDNSGELSASQLALVLELRADETASLLASLDTSRTGVISYSEWLAAGSSRQVFSCHREARRAFNALDSDGDGRISVQDLHKVLPHVFSPEELATSVKRYDLNGDGHIDFSEFRELLRDGGSLQSVDLLPGG